MLLSLGLFFFNIIYSEEPATIGLLGEQRPAYGFRITDLQSRDTLYAHEIAIENIAEGRTAHAHINRFDADIYADQPELVSSSRMTWVLALQWFSMAAMAAIAVITVVVLLLFYRSAKRGRLFPSSSYRWLRAIGLLLVLLSLSMDLSTYLERCNAALMLEGTEWVPEVHFSIHFLRIFFGLTIIFLAEIFTIGRQMQDEQDLTI